MQNFQYTFETRKGSFISAFSIRMTVPLNVLYNTFDLDEQCENQSFQQGSSYSNLLGSNNYSCV